MSMDAGGDIGFGAFRFAAEESMSRLAICEVVSGLVTSLGEVEGAFARSLAKVGKLNLDEQQTESMSVIVSGWAAAVKAITATAGKQHAQVAVVVAQEVSKSLADVARLNSKRVQDIVQFVKVKNHDIARAKAAQQKLLERYRKGVDDTEVAIRQRDAAILDEDKKASTSSVAAKGDKGDASGIAMVKDDSFMNRSLNMMKSKMKMAPSDVTRRAADKCREMLRELDVAEAQLVGGCQRINGLRDEFLVDVETALKELCALEASRLRSMHDGLLAMCRTQYTLVEQRRAAAAALVSNRHGIDFNPQSEVAALMKAVEDSRDSGAAGSVATAPITSAMSGTGTGTGTAKAAAVSAAAAAAGDGDGSPDSARMSSPTSPVDAENAYIDVNRHAEWKKDTTAQFHQIQRMMEVLDVLKVLVNWVGHALKDTAEASRTYAKAIRVLCERHGFPNTSASARMLDGDDDASSAASESGLRCAELMAGVESPTIKAAWQFAVQAIEDGAVVYQRTAATYSDELIPALSAVDKNLRALKKELHEAQTSGMKDIDAAQTWIQKLSQKLTKLRHELKEQRRKLAAAKGAAVMRDGDASDDSGPEDSAMSAASAATAGGAALEGTRLEMIKNTVRDKLRFESVEDRVARRQARVARLECDERDLVESIGLANASFERVLTATTAVLAKHLAVAKEVFSKDALSLFGTLRRLSAVQTESVAALAAPHRHFEETLQHIDLAADGASYVSAVLVAAGACQTTSSQDATGAAVVILDVPETLHFVPTKSTVIEDERHASGTARATSPTSVGAASEPSHLLQAPIGSSSNASSSLSRGREKAQIAVKKLFASSSTFVPVMKPDSLMKKLTSSGRSRAASPSSTAPPGPGLVQEGSLLLPSVAPAPARTPAPAPIPAPAPATAPAAAGAPAAAVPEAKDAASREWASSPISEGGEEHEDALIKDALSAAFDEGPRVDDEARVPPASTPPQPHALSPSSTDLPTASRVRRKRIARPDAGADEGAGAESVLSGGGGADEQTPSVVTVNATPLRRATAEAMANPPVVTTVAAVPITSASPLRKTASASSSTTGTATASEAIKAEDLAELAKFGLGPGPRDRILESFSCALYPKKGLLSHGRMFVTPQFLAFSGWPDCRVLLSLKDISKVEKTNTLLYIPNAILVHSKTHGEFFFGSFIDRDVCHSLLTGMSQVSKRLGEIDGGDGSGTDARDLVFGIQMPKGGVGSIVEDLAEYANLAVDQEKREAFWNTLTATYQQAGGGVAGAMAAAKVAGNVGATAGGGGVAALEDAPDGVLRTTSPARAPVAAATAAMYDVATAGADAASLVERQRQLARVRAALEAETDLDDGVHLDALAGTSGGAIESICTYVFPCLTADLFRTCWLYANGYGSFLRHEGDLEIKTSEWVRRNPATVVEEDAAKLPFTYERTFTYSHPRTTMLMFGPKNAPAKQTHYLYLPVKDPPVAPVVPVNAGKAEATKLRKKVAAAGLAGSAATSTSTASMAAAAAAAAAVADDLGTDSDSDDGLSSDWESSNNAVWRDSGCLSDESVDLAEGGKDPLSVLRRHHPRRGCVMTVTQFDGIPMADCFKVVQYWSFERGGHGKSAASTTVRSDVAVHFLKKTILRGQVVSGVRDELRDLSKRWCAYYERRVAPAIAPIGGLETYHEEDSSPSIVTVGAAAAPDGGGAGAAGVGAGPLDVRARARTRSLPPDAVAHGTGKPPGLVGRLFHAAFSSSGMLVLAVGAMSAVVVAQMLSHRAMAARVATMEARIDNLHAIIAQQHNTERFQHQ